jgi:hypothetical protein
MHADVVHVRLHLSKAAGAPSAAALGYLAALLKPNAAAPVSTHNAVEITAGVDQAGNRTLVQSQTGNEARLPTYMRTRGCTPAATYPLQIMAVWRSCLPL